MKKFPKTLVSLLSLGLLMSSTALCGCSSPIAADGDFGFSDAAQPVETDSGGYAIWRMGKNDLGNGVVLDFSDFHEEDVNDPYPSDVCYWLDAFSTESSLLSSYLKEKFITINANKVKNETGHLGDTKPEDTKKQLKNQYEEHAHLLVGPSKDHFTASVCIGQTLCSSFDVLKKRLQQAKNEGWEIAEKVTDTVYKFKEGYKAHHGVSGDAWEEKEAGDDTQDTWYATITDGTLTVWTIRNAYLTQHTVTNIANT